ncbi:MAG: hypothetical protein AB7I30_06635 [Isosphaeraceae bacterium]
MTVNSNPNSNQNAVPTDLGRLIDRLVDGALSDEDRKALLFRLEAEPDGSGWRRCALTFLEDQDWRGALSWRTNPDLQMRTIDQGIAARPGSSADLGRRSSRWLATAASLALAFSLGWASRPTVTDPLDHGPALVRVPVPEVEPGMSPPNDDPTLDDWLVLDGRSPALAPEEAGTSWRPSPVAAPRAEGSPWTWSNPPGPSDVPELPAPVVEDWRRRGYEVEARPTVVSIDREDGRTIPFPVNEVRVRYVGDRTY